MVKFTYKMENILRIKYKMEEQAKTAYGNARLRLTKEEELLNSYKNKLVNYQGELVSLMYPNLKITEIKHCENAIETMKYYIKQQQIAVAKAEKQLEAARVRLNAAMVERKIHEKLKEKAMENYKREYEAEQRKEIDELVSFKYNHPADGLEE
jgi:flagellar FliJ protein